MLTYPQLACRGSQYQRTGAGKLINCRSIMLTSLNEIHNAFVKNIFVSIKYS